MKIRKALGIYVVISIIAILLCAIALVFNKTSYAQIVPVVYNQYDQLPLNHVQINELELKDALFTKTNNLFEFIDNTNGQISGLGNGCGIYYHGALTYGQSNRTNAADAVTATNNISGSFSLLFSDGAILSDGKTANVKITISDISFELGANIGAQANSFYIPLIVHFEDLNFINAIPHTTPAYSDSSTSTIANSATKYKVTVEILDKETGNPVSSDYEQMLFGLLDLDLIDSGIAYRSTLSQKFDGEYSESVLLKSGFIGPVALAPNTSDPVNTNLLKTINVNGDLRILGDGTKYQAKQDAGSTANDAGTFNSGFIVPVNPQSFSFYWYGSSYNSTGNWITGTNFYNLPKPKVLATAGTGGTIAKPGVTEYVLNSNTTYNYTPAYGYKVKSLKVDGVEQTLTEAQKLNGGAYIFEKLYRNPLSTATTPEYTIDVEFEALPKYTVTYQFEGIVPPNASNLLPGVVEYLEGESVTVASNPQAPDGYVFNGWDRTGTFNMPGSNVVIKGTWSKLFEPTITKTIENEKSFYTVGDTIRFKMIVTNTLDKALTDVIVKENTNDAHFVSGTGYTVQSDHFAKINNIPANGTATVYSEYTVTNDNISNKKNIAEIKGALSEEGYILKEKDYIAEKEFDLKAKLKICKNISGTDLGNTFQFKISNNSFETWMTMKKDQCKTIYIDAGTYKVEEIIPQEYSVSNVTGAITSNNSNLVIEDGKMYTINYTNTSSKKGFMHSYGRVNNKVEGANPYTTVLYNDGTLIINEYISDRESNVSLHGNVVKEYLSFGEHDYVFDSSNSQLWVNEKDQITRVEIGSIIKPTSTARWFSSISKLCYSDVSKIDASQITSTSSMFAGTGTVGGMAQAKNCDNYIIVGLDDWDTSSVTDMSSMFGGSSYSLQSSSSWNIGNLSNWDTSNVTNMSSMFTSAGSNAVSWNDIGELDVYASNISNMFYGNQSAKATLNIYSNSTTYTNAFTNAAVNSGAGITVNYSSATTNIDNIIATKSSNSNVVKGSLLD